LQFTREELFQELFCYEMNLYEAWEGVAAGAAGRAIEWCGVE
jgi:hypothetical protein